MKSKAILLWVFWIGLFLWLINSDLTTGTKSAILIGVLIYLLVQTQGVAIDKRIRRVENKFGLIDDTTEEEKLISSPSYKLDVVIEPNWSAIVDKVIKGDRTSVNNFIEEIYKNRELKKGEDGSLYGKQFRFVYFYGGVSGLEQIWSDHYKTFVDEMEIRGDIFDSEGMHSSSALKRHKENNLADTLVVTPSFIGFHTILPDGGVMDEDKLSTVPFGEITRFLMNLHKDLGLWGPMYKIKKFPDELAQKLEENKIKYEDWDYEDYGCGGDAEKNLLESEWTKKNDIEIYDQKMRSQIFNAPYYSIRIRMEVF